MQDAAPRGSGRKLSCFWSICVVSLFYSLCSFGVFFLNLGLGLPDQGVHSQIFEVFPKNWNLVEKETRIHTCALVACDFFASRSLCQSTWGLPVVWTAAAWGTVLGWGWAAVKCHGLISWLNHPEAARLLLSFPPLFTVGQLPQFFKPCHGLVGLADPAANCFYFFPSSYWIKELSWHVETSSECQIQHKRGREKLPSCKSQSEEKPSPFSGSNTSLNPPSSATPGAVIVFGVALGSLPAWSGQGATGRLPAASPQRAFFCEPYGFLRFHPSNCTVSVSRSKFDWNTDCFMGCWPLIVSLVKLIQAVIEMLV